MHTGCGGNVTTKTLKYQHARNQALGSFTRNTVNTAKSPTPNDAIRRHLPDSQWSRILPSRVKA